ncbi:putative MerR family transcriptional regulator [Gordonia effusa NBRC 100432]|uniref:Putative MerR family transcriptional regulator n=1 Tax=Gordonia effusa NBRC 100432 TaxID=1077974 RepID=H0QZU7_9ACTN|nr:MerR family transcriptional regulator [Gordonia effusa]GAB18348.1 putative MerR family transcriptional regulator [Gordonia effusa NBRC 100432]
MLIGEVSRHSGVSARMLRHYDSVGLVRPTGRTSGGYREYSADDIRRLFHVESLRTLGLSLSDVKRALDEPDFAPADLVTELIVHTRARIVAEQELLANLERVDAAEPSEWADVLRIVSMLAALGSDSAGRRQQAVLTADAESALPASALVDALLVEDNPNVAGALRWALGRSTGDASASLAAALASPDTTIRGRAIAAVDALADHEAVRVLKIALTDHDIDIADRAALGLGRRGALDAVSSLLAMIVAGRRDVEAAEVLGALDELSAGADIIAAVREAISSQSAQPERLRLTQALAEFPGDAAVSTLDQLTGDLDQKIAATAAAILRSRAN